MRYLSFLCLTCQAFQMGCVFFLALLRGGHPRMQLNSLTSRLHPRAAPVRASLRRRLSAEHCETSCERLTCVSFAVFPTSAECFEAPPPHLRCVDYLLKNAKLLCLTCRGLHALPARLSLHALSSQARHWLELHTIMFWTLTISSMDCTWVTFKIPAISGNFCNTEFQAQLDINGH